MGRQSQGISGSLWEADSPGTKVCARVCVCRVCVREGVIWKAGTQAQDTFGLLHFLSFICTQRATFKNLSGKSSGWQDNKMADYSLLKRLEWTSLTQIQIFCWSSFNENQVFNLVNMFMWYFYIPQDMNKVRNKCHARGLIHHSPKEPILSLFCDIGGTSVFRGVPEEKPLFNIFKLISVTCLRPTFGCKVANREVVSLIVLPNDLNI